MEEVVGSIPTRSTKTLDNLSLLYQKVVAPAMLVALAGTAKRKNYFIFPIGMGMSELKMSHSVFHVPFDFFSASIHLPWST